ncbi:hypothetical protein SmJEL517_g05404 [Synchytrium microbalum]|uniref:DNA 3'-5' helicase n=1 Tax=Synchytrium microbalum TaxID=1806994 RepID=A0A507BWB2_9FUNG|nr:uncharacterized protein SmJEL517_g05404 [Synchytrium microbalum]TPX31189.1 hypothetical protein SmJEL517_g05404 [Synchytrium microbalum]
MDSGPPKAGKITIKRPAEPLPVELLPKQKKITLRLTHNNGPVTPVSDLPVIINPAMSNSPTSEPIIILDDEQPPFVISQPAAPLPSLKLKLKPPARPPQQPLPADEVKNSNVKQRVVKKEATPVNGPMSPPRSTSPVVKIPQHPLHPSASINPAMVAVKQEVIEVIDDDVDAVVVMKKEPVIKTESMIKTESVKAEVPSSSMDIDVEDDIISVGSRSSMPPDSKPLQIEDYQTSDDDDDDDDDIPRRKSDVYDDEANKKFDAAITTDPNYQNMKIIDTTSFIPKKAGLSAAALVSTSDVPPPPPDFLTSRFPENSDFRNLDLLPDHALRPLIITPDGTMILEGYSTLAKAAKDFLTTVAEPSSRPARMHEYKLTSFSLYAAVSVGVETNVIIKTLQRFSKTVVPRNIIKFIKECTHTYGKVRLVLKNNRYHVESAHPEILSMLLKDEVIAGARVISDTVAPQPAPEERKAMAAGIQIDDMFGAVITVDRDDESDDEDAEATDDLGILSSSKKNLIDLTESFEIRKNMVETVRRRCRELDYPLLEEYAYTEDTANPTLDLTLKGTTAPRDYQAKALYKLLGGQNRARSGIVVLPTGAGKTLVGIAAASAIKKSVLVLCTNALSVSQWETEFKRWANVPDGAIAAFTAQSKDAFKTPAGILISTYTMMSNQGERAKATQEVLEFINSREWGLVILDEVHVIPAKVFRRVLTIVAAHAKLGLTATLVREDDKIQDLNFLIGPKLYEADWLELMDAGHIARVDCTEVWCPMPSAFYDLYMKASANKRRLISVLHPGKFNVCQWLIKWRESLGDRILVFSDNVFALEFYAKALNKPYIHGGVDHRERMGLIRAFKAGDTRFPTLFLSKVGDTSLDLPEATCLIQINSQFGSRRQEAQRMGRILRAKRRTEPGFKAHFFTLVSKDTDEVYWSQKRRTWLVDQGFEFTIIDDIYKQIPPDQAASLLYVTPEAQNLMLAKLVEANDDDARDEVVPGANDGFEVTTKTGRKKTMTRTQREKLQQKEERRVEREERPR